MTICTFLTLKIILCELKMPPLRVKSNSEFIKVLQINAPMNFLHSSILSYQYHIFSAITTTTASTTTTTTSATANHSTLNENSAHKKVRSIMNAISDWFKCQRCSTCQKVLHCRGKSGVNPIIVYRYFENAIS